MLVQVEAFVNSRPLFRNDKMFDFLTPAHLVLGRPLMKLAPVPTSPIGSIPLAQQYRILQRKINAAWRKLSQEYLVNLRHCANKASREAKIGELVILMEPNFARDDWPVGVIEDLYAGRDGHKRVAKVKLLTGEVRERAVQRLVPLEATVFTKDC